MAHITSIGAGMFSDLSISLPSTLPVVTSFSTQANLEKLFAAEILPNGTKAGDGTAASVTPNTFVRINNAREFPSLGTPPNIVNVPTYGQKTSQQIQGQADAPSLEITINYIPDDWSSTSLLGIALANKSQTIFRFALLNVEPDGYESDATGLGTVENTCWYWVGKMEALLVNPQLTDANTASLSLSIQSDFYGSFTVAAA